MSKVLLPEKLLIGRSDFYILGKRALERIIIMGLLYDTVLIGDQLCMAENLSVRKALEYIEKLGYTTNRFRVHTAFKELIEDDWLTVVKKGSYHGRGHPYYLTEKAKQVYLDSNRFYGSLSAYHNRKPLKP